MAEKIQHERNGYLFEPASPTGLEEALRWFASNPECIVYAKLIAFVIFTRTAEAGGNCGPNSRTSRVIVLVGAVGEHVTRFGSAMSDIIGYIRKGRLHF